MNQKAVIPLGELLGSDMMRRAKFPLPVALGKEESGKPVIRDLAEMQSLLISGQAGSGKSASLHAVILSLIIRTLPDDVRLVLIDPRGIELRPYEGIPHLLMPVVTEAGEAEAALKQVQETVSGRFGKFREKGAVNMEDYNRIVSENGGERMARIVIVIDEVWDILKENREKTEPTLGLLAQYGQAAGVYLVVSTQVPSFFGIRDLFRSRIAFRLPNAEQSRAALNMTGAEEIDGYGDMLYLPCGSVRPDRIRCGYADRKEIERITGQVRAIYAAL